MKEYVKPELYYESFELSQHIAACGIDMSNPTIENSCTATLDSKFWGGLSDQVFNRDISGCSTAVEDIEVYCYTYGTTEAGKVFNS